MTVVPTRRVTGPPPRPGRDPSERKIRTRKRRAECQGVIAALDGREFARGPVAGGFAEFHPEQIIEAGPQPPHDFLENLEAGFPPIPLHTCPVADHERGVAALDHLHQPAPLQIASDEAVGALRRAATITRRRRRWK